MNKQMYATPSLEKLGPVEALTGTKGKCYDIIPGNEKGLGGPMDWDYRYGFVACDLPGEDLPS